MIHALLTAGLLVGGGLLAMAVLALRKRFEAAISAIRAQQRAMSDRLARIEAALAEKAAVTDARHLASMVDGVASVCHRVEGRLSVLEGRSCESRRESVED